MPARPPSRPRATPATNPRTPGARLGAGVRGAIRTRRPTGWGAAVPLIALAAGLLFATSATVSRGTNLRNDSNDGLVGLVRAAQDQVSTAQGQVNALDRQVRERTDRAAGGDDDVRAAARQAAALRTPAGLRAQRGPGLRVSLDDSHDPDPDPAIDPNELVVHQSDLQAAVNALWAGGAEAMSVAGQRLIATSAVRCVGNTLLLNGQVFSPPFTIEAIGPASAMRAALSRSPGVRLFVRAADALGLGYAVTEVSQMTVPAYDAPVVLNSAKVTR